METVLGSHLFHLNKDLLSQTSKTCPQWQLPRHICLLNSFQRGGMESWFMLHWEWVYLITESLEGCMNNSSD